MKDNSMDYIEMIYCATSICQGIQVDHIFEAEDDETAIKFIEANGWQTGPPEIQFKPSRENFKPKLALVKDD